MSLDYPEIIMDLEQTGCKVRINDLDEAIEIRLNGKDWQRMDDTTEAILKTKMRQIGYGGKQKPSLGAMRDALIMHADENRYKPVKEYFNKVIAGIYHPKPSGTYLIPELACFFSSPYKYSDSQASGMLFGTWLFRWMVGAIAKLFEGERNPILVLVSEQGRGKSYFAKWLCPLKNHFLKSTINPDSKDAVLRLVDTFVWEVEELGATTRRADTEALKAFITKPFVYERPPYGRYPIHKPVSASFIGTVNHDGTGFLTDPTGSTRFLACTIENIDFSYTQMNIDHLWAEAFWFYRHVPDSWRLTDYEKERQSTVNSQFESNSALLDVIEAHFDLTNNENDFMTNLAIKDLVVLHYRMSSEQHFYYDLNRVLTKVGLKKGRKVLENNRQYRGWYGIRKADVK